MIDHLFQSALFGTVDKEILLDLTRARAPDSFYDAFLRKCEGLNRTVTSYSPGYCPKVKGRNSSSRELRKKAFQLSKDKLCISSKMFSTNKLKTKGMVETGNSSMLLQASGTRIRVHSSIFQLALTIRWYSSYSCKETISTVAYCECKVPCPVTQNTYSPRSPIQ